MSVEILNYDQNQLDNLSTASFFALKTAPGIEKNDGSLLLDTTSLFLRILTDVSRYDQDLVSKLDTKFRALHESTDSRKSIFGVPTLIYSDLKRVLDRGIDIALEDGEQVARYDHLIRAIEHDSLDQTGVLIRNLPLEDKTRLYKASQKADEAIEIKF